MANGDTSLCGLQTVPISCMARRLGAPFQYSWFPTASVANPNSANTTVSPQDSTAYIVRRYGTRPRAVCFDTIR
ncbi:MAG: hypothetical protein R3B47_00635 [Bacteroidia bacterium]